VCVLDANGDGSLSTRQLKSALANVTLKSLYPADVNGKGTGLGRLMGATIGGNDAITVGFDGG